MTLNERAAKCMGWQYLTPFGFPEGECREDSGKCRRPQSCLDDAALVEAEAIKRHGWDAYRNSLDGITEPIDFRSMILATAAQRTEAAARTMENHQ